MTEYQTLFAYHWHTTNRLLEGAARLSDATYHENPGFGHGSIHDLLVHLLRTMQGWRVALETGRQAVASRPEDYVTLASIKDALAAEQAAWSALLGGYDAAAIAGTVSLTNWRGDTLTIPLWRVLQHVVLHGMQHHAELAQLLTARGQSPGDIDFIYYNN